MLALLLPTNFTLMKRAESEESYSVQEKDRVSYRDVLNSFITANFQLCFQFPFSCKSGPKCKNKTGVFYTIPTR